MELELLSAALPFLGEELLAEDVRYSGLGVTLQGRDAYAAATAAWSRVLPQRLGRLQCERKTVLPPDSRRRVTARYSLEFEAPVPPQVLPAQRARLLRAGVPTSGLVAVRATIVGTIELTLALTLILTLTLSLSLSLTLTLTLTLSLSLSLTLTLTRTLTLTLTLTL